MDKNWWFFKDGFMNWLKSEFIAENIGLNTHWTYDLVNNLIDYGLKVTETPHDFIGMMVNIVPEVNYEEWQYWVNK